MPLSVSQTGYFQTTDSANLETLASKRKHVANELLETERVYVMELKSILEGYIEELRNPASQNLVPSHILGQEDILFGNIENIYQFHKDIFLRDLENCIEAHGLIGLCFIQRKEALHDLYTIYCQNKPKSEALRSGSGDNLPFFKECQKRLGHKLPLSAYLLKPVQRITKYQLLLKELLKYSNDGRGRQELQEAVDCMLNVIRFVNDSMHQVAITGFPGCLSTFGRLLLQGSFNVWCERKSDRLKELRLKPMQRHLFLYEKALLFCKKVGKYEDHPTYAFKRCLKMSQVGLTETIKVSKGTESRKFELWTPGRTEVYVIEAPSLGTKELWVKEVKAVLLEQFAHIKQHNSAKVQKFESLNGVRALQNDVATSHMHFIEAGNWRPRKQCSLSNKTYSGEDLRYGMNKRPSSMDRVTHESGKDSAGCRPRSKSASSRPFLPVCREQRDFKRMLPNYDEQLLDKDEVGNDEEVWSADEEFDENPFGRAGLTSGSEEHLAYSWHLVALSDYDAMDAAEVTLREGDIVELVTVGSGGWWFVSVVGTEERGWAPASYLEHITKRTSKSSSSASSQDSVGASHDGRKYSVTSTFSLNSE